jgi:hypothetical protein
MSLTPRYWWRKWCRVWRAWHLDIDDESDVKFDEEVSGSSHITSLSSSISRCQALQTLHHFRHQYRGVRLIKLYINFFINIEVSGSSNFTSISSSISSCQAHQTLHHFRNQYRGVRLFKLYINFVINIEVSGSSNSTSLSSSISRCQVLQTLHHFRHQYRGVRLFSRTPRYWLRKWCKVWWAWQLDIDDESDVKFDEPDTSILMKKLM